MLTQLTQLALLRHGRAAGQSSDADLVPEGEAQIRALGRRLAAEGFVAAAAFSSPYRRAERTASMLLAALVSAARPTTLRELAPDGEAGAALDALVATQLPPGRVLVVGHMPLLGEMTMRLTGKEISFSPGTLVEIELAPGAASGRFVRRLVPEELAS